MRRQRQTVPKLDSNLVKQVALLNDDDAEKRTAALQELQNLGRDDVVRSLLASYEWRKRRYPRQVALAICGGVALGTAFSVVYHVLTGYNGFPAFLGGLPGLAMGLITSWLIFQQSRNNKIAGLSALDDVRGIGPLTDALEFGDRKTRTLAKQALTRILPRLQAGDSHLLNTAQRHALHKILIGMDTLQTRFPVPMKMASINITVERSLDKFAQEQADKPMTDEQRLRLDELRRKLAEHPINTEAELRVAILKALEQVGAADSLPHVQDVAAGATKTSEDVRVRRAAQECLPFLQTRAVLQDAQTTLLRPTQTQERRPETLLRPAVGTGEPNAQRLLRPNQIPE